MENRICVICGKEYKPTYKNQQCCCKSCAISLRNKKVAKPKITKICPVCGKEFLVYANAINRICCSKKCSDIYRNTQVEKICEICGTSFKVIKCREHTAKYCSRKCSDIALKGKNNVVCTYCGKPFHMKKYQQEHYDRTLGYFCSRECLNKAKEILYCGSNNHQYGLKGPLNASFINDDIICHNHKLNDVMVYCPTHPYANKNGRIKKHRLLVEQNYQLFDIKYFSQIDNNYYLKPEIDVHHLDGNHDNNDITNLIPCTKSEHRYFHNSKINKKII